MLRVDTDKWGQSVDDLRRLSVAAPHHRTRERFQALFMIASGQANATTWAERVGRHDETVLGWVHAYNTRGPEALAYRRTGGTAPLLRRTRPGPSPTPPATPSRSNTAFPATAGR